LVIHLGSLECIFGDIGDLGDFEMDLLPTGGLSRNFRLLMQRVCAAGVDDKASTVSPYFERVAQQPSSENVVNALFLAALLDWCFITPFHTSGLESQKLGQLYEAIAHYGGLEQVRHHDGLAIAKRVTDAYFKTHKMPDLAKRQVLTVAQTFAGKFPSHEESLMKRLTKLLKLMMQIKVDVLYAFNLYKLSYVPAGQAFDYNIMLAVDENMVDMDIERRDASKYRVRLCLEPFLVTTYDHELPEDKGTARDYREALLESRNFFPEDGGQYMYREDPHALVVGKAMVLVEEVAAGVEGDVLDL
jgi:hypothetical protein